MVHNDGTGVAHDLGLSDDPRLRRAVAGFCLRVCAASPWSILACGISLRGMLATSGRSCLSGSTYNDGLDPRLVQGDPILHPVAKALVAHPCVPLKVELGLFDIQPSAIPVVKALRKVPVIQGYPWRDAPSEQGINESVVEGDAVLVDRVVAATLRDDPRPRQGESVRLGAVAREKIKVLLVPMVMIAGYVAVGAVGPRGLEMAEGVPDGFPPTVFGDGTLYLVRCCCKSPFEVAGKGRRAVHCCAWLVFICLVFRLGLTWYFGATAGERAASLMDVRKKLRR